MTEPGTWQVRRITAADRAVGIDVHERIGAEPGPHLVVLGGVHGDEVGGIVAAGRIASTEWPLRAGRLTVVPVSHEVAQLADARVSPLDGGNLARSFPGRPDGTPTQQLADLIARHLIARADVLIDLHTSNAAADMPLFVGCLDDGSPGATRAVRLALGFGMPLLWTHPTLGAGRTLTVAAERGIPALYVESPVGGVLDVAVVTAYVEGVRSVLEALAMIDPAPPLPPHPFWVHGNGDTDSFTAVATGGYFERAAALLDHVRAGDPVGRVLDPLGRTIEQVRAPVDGVITTLQRTATVTAGRPVVGVTAPRPAVLGIASDDLILTTRSSR